MRPLATRPGTLIQRAELPANPPSFTSAPRRLPSLSTAVFCLIGLVGGGYGGLLGIGGGSAIAPLLLIFASLRPSQVSGTTLATVLVISEVGSGTYASLGHLNFGVAWPIAVGSIIGSVSGALASGRLSLRIMVLMFMVILPYFAVKELWPSFAAPIIAPHLIALGALGLGTGFLSGLLGISGASLVVPSLVGFFLIDHHAAQGIAMGVALADSAAGVATHARARNIDYRVLPSLVGFFLIDHHAAQGIAMGVALADSAAGVATHARARNIDYRVLPYVAVPALFTAIGEAALSHSLQVGTLRVIFGSFMLVIWVVMLAHFVLNYYRARAPSSGGTGCQPVPANRIQKRRRAGQQRDESGRPHPVKVVQRSESRREKRGP